MARTGPIREDDPVAADVGPCSLDNSELDSGHSLVLVPQRETGDDSRLDVCTRLRRRNARTSCTSLGAERGQCLLAVVARSIEAVLAVLAAEPLEQRVDLAFATRPVPRVVGTFSYNATAYSRLLELPTSIPPKPQRM